MQIQMPKKVLGEVNTNLKVMPKDDSEVGKTSPGKLHIQYSMESQPVAPPLARQAVRPLAAKTVSSQNIINMPATSIPTKAPATTQVTEIDAQPLRKLLPKKSKIIKENVVSAEPEVQDKFIHLTGIERQHQPVHPYTAEPEKAALITEQPNCNSADVRLQEVRTTESVPLRDESAVRPEDQPVNSVATAVNNINIEARLGYVSDLRYYTYLPEVGQVGIQLENHVDVQPYPIQVQQLPTPTYEGEDNLDQYDDEDDYDDDGFSTTRSGGLHGESTGGLTIILAPRYTKKAEAEIAAAKIVVESSRSAEDIEDEMWDTSMVAEYGDDIFDYMREMESRMAPNPNYMDQQQEIQWSMRAVLMDWVVQVHQRFNLLPETLFLTVNYIDRFLSCKIVSLGKLQLVGATAIFLAAKYEEVNCPTISEIIYMVDGGYSADELLKAERFMLSMLQFELGWPGPMSFLRRISKADDYDLETRTLAKYFLEVTIMDERFVGCVPSFLAAGAHCLARLMLRKGDWSQAHVYYSNYTLSQLRRLLQAILDCCGNPHLHHAAVFDKYTDKRYKRASTFVEGEIGRDFKLPSRVSRASSMGPQEMPLNWIRQ